MPDFSPVFKCLWPTLQRRAVLQFIFQAASDSLINIPFHVQLIEFHGQV